MVSPWHWTISLRGSARYWNSSPRATTTPRLLSGSTLVKRRSATMSRPSLASSASTAVYKQLCVHARQALDESAEIRRAYPERNWHVTTRRMTVPIDAIGGSGDMTQIRQSVGGAPFDRQVRPRAIEIVRCGRGIQPWG